MNFDEMELAEFPLDFSWVRRLRQGNVIWLVKEREFAIVTSRWKEKERDTATMFSSRLGRLSLNWRRGYENWLMCQDGRGGDTKRLIRPVVGHLLDEEFSSIISSNGNASYNSPHSHSIFINYKMIEPGGHSLRYPISLTP